MARDPENDIAQLRFAVERRKMIGIALGIVMEQYDLDQSDAFACLHRLASTRQSNLYDVARGLVETRELPEEPSA